MTRSKDLKRLVRERMRKTGEAYTTARAQIAKRAVAKTAKKASTEPAAQPQPADDYAKIAGVSDAVITEKSGRDWKSWKTVLDAEGAHTLAHRALADLIHTKFKVGPWWTQMVAVGYERLAGLRVRGQRRDGSYSASKSLTIQAPHDVVFKAITSDAKRKAWLGAGTRVRTATPPHSIRLGMQDGTVAALWIDAKGEDKCTVGVQRDKLPSQAASEEFKKEWTERLKRFAATLS